MISLEWYRTFKAVYKHRNYSKAAEELFMSQPAVSNQMSMLEAYVGHKLFTRKSKGVEATENAKFLNNLIIESLDTLEEVEAFMMLAFSFIPAIMFLKLLRAVPELMSSTIRLSLLNPKSFDCT